MKAVNGVKKVNSLHFESKFTFRFLTLQFLGGHQKFSLLRNFLAFEKIFIFRALSFVLRASHSLDSFNILRWEIKPSRAFNELVTLRALISKDLAVQVA